MIKLNEEEKIITNSKNDVIEYNKENLTKFFLQDNIFKLNDDMTWNKNFNEALNILRIKRDLKLKETDYLFLSDTVNIYPEELRNKKIIERQKLRYITENLNTVEEVILAIKSIK